jgi:type I restriction enzyme M protein
MKAPNLLLKNDSLDQLDDMPPPEVLQQEIIEHLEAALASFCDVAAGLPRHRTRSP